MAFQKGFYGVSVAGTDTGSQGLVQALGSMSKSMEKYGEYVGSEQDKKVMAQAQKAARIDDFKSYQDAVDSGEIENTKSDFYIAHYDNIKGQNAGAAYQTKKNMGYQQFWADQTNADRDDLTGEEYLAWSQNYDKENYGAFKNQSSYFMKSLDTNIAQVNQQLSATYSANNTQRVQEKYKFEYITRSESILNTANPIERKEGLLNLDANSSTFRALPANERKAAMVQAYQNKIATLATVGGEDADFELAIELAEELRDFKGTNGFTLLQGEDIEKQEDAIQNLRAEKIKHDNNRIALIYGKEIDDAVDAQAKQLWGEMTESYQNTGKEGSDKANFALDEYQQRAARILATNKNSKNPQPPAVMKTRLRDLKVNTKAKYDALGDKQRELTAFSFRAKNQYNIRKNKDHLKTLKIKLIDLIEGSVPIVPGGTTMKKHTFVEALKIIKEQDMEFDDGTGDSVVGILNFALASAVQNNFVNNKGQVTLESFGAWYKDYLSKAGPQRNRPYDLSED